MLNRLFLQLSACERCNARVSSSRLRSLWSSSTVKRYSTKAVADDTTPSSHEEIDQKSGVSFTRTGGTENHLPVEWTKPEGYDTGIQVYNSATKRKDPLILPHGKAATWYSCGPTVYDKAHIGHASCYIRSDVIRRVLVNFFNIDVVQVMGVTDIDDKIIKRSQEINIPHGHLAQMYEQDFFNHMTTLKVIPPTVITRVTEHMPAIIKFVQRIMDNGYAYRTSTGSVYFDVTEYGRYGRLWTHSMDTVLREPVDKEKRSARDFALWKAAKPGEPSWSSPWGKGRPGWHIECSTMASSIFGEELDIHTGGDDLRFPHHENELAQSEACFQCAQWTNYWFHIGHLHLKNDSQKMSKSLNNTLSVTEVLEKYSVNQFRLFCMLVHYRQNIEFSDETMKKAVSIQKQLSSFLSSGDAYIRGHLVCGALSEADLTTSLMETRTKVTKALGDDFDTPRAIEALMHLVKQGNIALGKKSENIDEARSPGVIAAMMAYIDRVLDLLGIHFMGRKTMYDSNAETQLGQVLDNVVKFRSKVRNLGLTESSLTKPLEEQIKDKDAVSVTKSQLKDLQKKEKRRKGTLLKACDELRDGLQISGIQVQDHGKESGWVMLEQKQEQTGNK